MLGGPQDRSGRVRKISFPPGHDPRTVQPVVSRYTDWATWPTCLYHTFTNTIIPRLMSFGTYVFCHQTRRIKLRAQILSPMLKITVTGWQLIGTSRRGSSCNSEVKSSWWSYGPWIWSWGQAHDVMKLTECRGLMETVEWDKTRLDTIQDKTQYKVIQDKRSEKGLL
jgi:hypothetical protein